LSAAGGEVLPLATVAVATGDSVVGRGEDNGGNG